MPPTEEDAAVRRTIEDFELRGGTVPRLRTELDHTAERPQGVLVAAEYASSGVWGVDLVDPNAPHIGGLLRDHLGLPQELDRRFDEWIEWYWDYADESKRFDLDAFNQRGRELASELKRHLGADVRVYFSPERDDDEPRVQEEIELAG